MTNYDGIRIILRNKKKYVIEVNDKWYFYDRTLSLRGSFETEEEATIALKKEWEDYRDEEL